MNSLLKRRISGRNQNLLELRCIAIDCENGMEINGQYLRQRQRPPTHREFLLSIIERCQLTREIPEEIDHSIAKGGRLEVKEVHRAGERVIFELYDVKEMDRFSSLIPIGSAGRNRRLQKPRL
jgi:hypothetical protein